jgi:hypothetical protein
MLSVTAASGQLSVTVPTGTRYRLDVRGGGGNIATSSLIDATSSRVIDLTLGPPGKATVRYPS